ncbi:MAG: endo alpha-1,4 polygalactosaminidase [Spirochaetes bacterium]|nr:endo alpha-1,4 polygalactosaminidase [Spirochaetota bacterium]
MKVPIRLVLVFLGAACVSCGSGEFTRSDIPSVPPFGGPAVVSGVTLAPASWGYMLQEDAVAALDVSTFAAVVVDYSKDGTETGRYTQAEVTTMKTGGRKVLAYLSIGEAESYRSYFDPSWLGSDPPEWLGRENPDWEGNYKVLYWSADWQDIVFAYLDKLTEAGFDGVYLDIVDAFWHWSDPDNGEGLVLSEELTAERMISFIARIAAHARVDDTDFLVVPQNAEGILDFDASDCYLDSIDGIGIEDLFYMERTATSVAWREERLPFLDELKAAGKAVLAVDYVWTGSKDSTVDAFTALCGGKGYIPYAAAKDRDLDELVTFSGQGVP